MNPVALSDTVYIHFGTTRVDTGAATNADSLPVVVVAEDGVDMAYAPSVANVLVGLYIVTIVASAANGFEAGKRYSLYATATVNSITGRDGIGGFEVLTNDLNVIPTAAENAAAVAAAVAADIALLDAADVAAAIEANSKLLTTAKFIALKD